MFVQVQCVHETECKFTHGYGSVAPDSAPDDVIDEVVNFWAKVLEREDARHAYQCRLCNKGLGSYLWGRRN